MTKWNSGDYVLNEFWNINVLPHFFLKNNDNILHKSLTSWLGTEKENESPISSTFPHNLTKWFQRLAVVRKATILNLLERNKSGYNFAVTLWDCNYLQYIYLFWVIYIEMIDYMVNVILERLCQNIF